jgi:hypothetical protein
MCGAWFPPVRNAPKLHRLRQRNVKRLEGDPHPNRKPIPPRREAHTQTVERDFLPKVSADQCPNTPTYQTERYTPKKGSGCGYLGLLFGGQGLTLEQTDICYCDPHQGTKPGANHSTDICPLTFVGFLSEVYV